MTKIKQITAKGFKSFATRIDLVFGDGFNIIIGPNGSGKSNVVDSLCFVLGKSSAKGLRAEKSANLIYNGGKKGKPAKEAEVNIVFCNEKSTFPLNEKEIVVSRIVKKGGNSVYKLNGKTKTRQEVIDLLNNAGIDPDGHNIILQGDIVHFMEMKSIERREVVEEIAGISIFDDKKNKALKELEKVQEKLTEADIILTEREANLRELKKDRDQAKQYKELESKIKDNKATFLHIKIKGKNDKKTAVEGKIKDFDVKIEQINSKIKEFKTRITDKREQINQINSEIESKGEKEQLVLRQEISELKEEVIKNKSRIDVLKNEMLKINERKKQLKANLSETNKEIKELENQKRSLNNSIKDVYLKEESVQREIRKFKEKHGIDKVGDLNEKLNSLDREIEEKNNLLLRANEEKQELLREKDRIEYEINHINTVLENFSGKDALRLKDLRKNFKDVNNRLGRCLNEESAFSAQLSNARRKLVANNEELARLKARNAGLRELNSGDYAIRKVKESKGVYGTVGELAAVQDEYALSLEVAAGPRINSMVVKDDVVAAKCIKMLKESRLGVVTFLPLNTLRRRVDSLRGFKVDGVVGKAIDLVDYDKKYEAVFDYVFGSTLVVKDINIARRIGIGRARMVTLDGDLMEPSGAMVGGFRKKMGRFNQKEVEGKIKEFSSEIDRLGKIISSLESKKSNNDDEISVLREKKAELEGEIIKIEKSLGGEAIQDLMDKKKSFTIKLRDLLSGLKQVDVKVNGVVNGFNVLKKERELIRNKLNQNPEIVEGLELLEGKRSKFKERSFEIGSEIKNIDNKIEMILSENEKVERIIKEADKEKEEFGVELESLLDEIKGSVSDLKVKEKKEQEFYGKFKDLAAKRNKFGDDIQKIEDFIINEEERVRGVESRRNDVAIVRAKIVAEIEAFEKEFEMYKDGKIRRGISFEELKSEIDEFDKMIRRIGNVNLRALEVYEDIKKDYEKLLEKVDKIKVEKEDVLDVISQIDQTKTVAFMKTFNDLKKNFEEIFGSLSSKGDAHLDLENKEEPLEGGVDIKVRIAGNKFLDIRGLSGGEKTLAALSFIFAIQEFNPASFYLMDEVDAALDKHNSEKLSKLIGKYAKMAQYIVISHNDNVISEAEQIYGVSMKEGISKVVSLRV